MGKATLQDFHTHGWNEMSIRLRLKTDLLKDRGSVDPIPDEVHCLEHGHTKGLEGAVLHHMRVMHVEIGEYGLGQGVTLQPRHLSL